MNTNTRLASLIAAGLLATGTFYGCSSDDNNTTPDSGVHPDAATGNPDASVTPDAGGGGFVQPSDTVPVNFTIDDSANKTYTAGEMRWKGNFTWNETERTLIGPQGWDGPFPSVYDDGPWNAGGHEPAGATAGDSIWGVTVFYPTPTADQSFEYGAEDNSGWIWRGSNGTFTIPANKTDPVNAQGLVIPAFGQIDLKLEIDTSTLAAGFNVTAGTTPVHVKGSAWSWGLIALNRDGTTPKYTFELGMNVGAGTARPHSGKLNSGDVPEFIFVFGHTDTDEGIEYKFGGAAALTGVKAYLKIPPATTWTEVPVTILSSNKNSAVTVP